MAAIDRGEPELSDEGSYATSDEDGVEISQKTFFDHGGEKNVFTENIF